MPATITLATNTAGIDLTAIVKKFQDLGHSADDAVAAAKGVSRELDSRKTKQIAMDIKSVANEFDGTTAAAEKSAQAAKTWKSVIEAAQRDVKAEQGRMAESEKKRADGVAQVEAGRAREEAAQQRRAAWHKADMDRMSQIAAKEREVSDARAKFHEEDVAATKKRISDFAGGGKTGDAKGGGAGGHGGGGSHAMGTVATAAQAVNSTGITLGYEQRLLTMGRLADKLPGMVASLGPATLALGGMALGVGAVVGGIYAMDKAGSTAAKSLTLGIGGLASGIRHGLGESIDLTARRFDMMMRDMGVSFKNREQLADEAFKKESDRYDFSLNQRRQGEAFSAKGNADRATTTNRYSLYEADKDRTNARNLKDVGQTDFGKIRDNLPIDRMKFDKDSITAGKESGGLASGQRLSQAERSANDERIKAREKALEEQAAAVAKRKNSWFGADKETAAEAEKRVQLEKEINQLRIRNEGLLNNEANTARRLTEIDKDRGVALADLNAKEARKVELMDREYERARQIANAADDEMRADLKRKFIADDLRANAADSKATPIAREKARKDGEAAHEAAISAGKREVELSNTRLSGLEQIRQQSQAAHEERKGHFKGERERLEDFTSEAKRSGQLWLASDTKRIQELRSKEDQEKNKRDADIKETRRLREEAAEAEIKAAVNDPARADQLRHEQRKRFVADELEDVKRVAEEKIEAGKRVQDKEEAAANFKRERELQSRQTALQDFTDKGGMDQMKQIAGSVPQRKIANQIANKRIREQGLTKSKDIRRETKRAYRQVAAESKGMMYRDKDKINAQRDLYKKAGNKEGLRGMSKRIRSGEYDSRMDPDEMAGGLAGGMNEMLGQQVRQGNMTGQQARQQAQMINVMQQQMARDAQVNQMIQQNEAGLRNVMAQAARNQRNQAQNAGDR